MINISSLVSNSFASLEMVSLSASQGIDSLDEVATVLSTDSAPQSLHIEGLMARSAVPNNLYDSVSFASGMIMPALNIITA